MNITSTDRLWAESVWEAVSAKLSAVRERSASKIPFTTVQGVHDDRSLPETRNFWTNGFWAGLLWQMYQATGDARYAQTARFTEGILDQDLEEFEKLHHDVGFMWMASSVADYRLTGRPEARHRGLHAASMLSGRFNPAGNYIRAWNEKPDGDTTGWAIIDCMMNLSILYWASEETGDPRFRHVAVRHADKSLRHFIRPDGSVKHIVEFDPDTGEEVCSYGGQGYATGSSWTRGQAWAIYGFMISYHHTHDPRYLDAAKRVAHYFIANIPENGRIPVDFRSPAEPFYEDDAATAIACCGMLEIAREVPENESDIYLRAAIRLLKVMAAETCDFSPETDGITTACSTRYYEDRHNYNLIYADYYFVEAVLKLLDRDFWLW